MKLRLLIAAVLMTICCSLVPKAAYSGTYYYNGSYYNDPNYPCDYPSYYDQDREVCIYENDPYWNYPTTSFFFNFRDNHRHHDFKDHDHFDDHHDRFDDHDHGHGFSEHGENHGSHR